MWYMVSVYFTSVNGSSNYVVYGICLLYFSERDFQLCGIWYLFTLLQLTGFPIMWYIVSVYFTSVNGSSNFRLCKSCLSALVFTPHFLLSMLFTKVSELPDFLGLWFEVSKGI